MNCCSLRETPFKRTVSHLKNLSKPALHLHIYVHETTPYTAHCNSHFSDRDTWYCAS